MIDIYETVTQRIILALENGTVPWLRPWRDNASGSALEPHNALSGRPYSGINLLVLGTTHYQSLGWLTFKQALELGGNVRKGEHGTKIVYWNFQNRDEETAKVIPFARAYTVFNVEQCENLDTAKIVAPKPAIAGETSVTALAATIGATVKHGGNRAFYIPSADYVAMPSRDAFESQAYYDGTLAHELTHWTGHEKRCNRQFGKRFGDDAYAFEELIAEIGSAFLCARLGVPLEGLRHADYLASWLKVLKTDKRAIFTAAGKAKAASTFLLADTIEHAEPLAA